MTIDILNQVIFLAVKWIAVALVVLTLVARSRNTSATTLHGVLFFTLASVFLLPVLFVATPKLLFEVVPNEYSFLMSMPIDFSLGFIFEGGVWFGSLIVIYCLVVIAFIVNSIKNMINVFNLGGRASDNEIHKAIFEKVYKDLGIQRKVTIKYSSDIKGPITYGVLRPKVLMPLDSFHWSEGRVHRFLIHELSHVKRLDWFWKMLSQWICALCWCVPTAWAVSKRIEWYAELACDDQVVQISGSRADYADDLLEMTAYVASSPKGAVSLIEVSGHYQRIQTVLDGGRIREAGQIKLYFYSGILLLMITLVSLVELSVIPLKSDSGYRYIPLSESLALAQDESDDLALGMSSYVGTNNSIEKPVDSIEKPRVSTEPVIVESKIDVSGILNENIFVASRLENLDLSAIPDLFIPGSDLELVHKVEPEYPKKALSKNLEGIVSVSFDVRANGSVTNIKIIQSDTKDVFDQSVMTAVQQYRYKPYLVSGEPVKLTGVLEVFKFELVSKK